MKQFRLDSPGHVPPVDGHAPTRPGRVSKLEQHATHIFAIALAASAAIWVVVLFRDYNHFLYDALDLGIYSQVFWNTSHGRWFAMSIHPQSYLGDHFEPLMLALTPIYMIWRDPRMLLLMQVVGVHLSAIPLYLLAKNIFSESLAGTNSRHVLATYPRLVALAIAISYLANPFVHNALAFEFHMLPFALLPIFAALYYAASGRFNRMLACLLVAVMVREDVALIVAPLGFVAYFAFKKTQNRRAWIWGLTPFMIATLWFAFAIAIVSRFSPTGAYKFTTYYTVPHGDLRATILAAMQAPATLGLRLIRIQNLETLAALLLPVSYLPVLAPLGLLLGVGPWLEFSLINPDSREILTLHYATLFLPAIYLSLVLAIRRLGILKTSASERLNIPFASRWPPTWPLEMAMLILLAASIYASITLGFAARRSVQRANQLPIREGERESLMTATQLSRSAPGAIVSSNRLLPYLSGREQVYLLRYALGGTQQLSTLPYVLPDDLKTLVLDQRDLIYPVQRWNGERYQWVANIARAKHLQNLLTTYNLMPVWARDGVALWQRGRSPTAAVPFVSTVPFRGAGTPLAPNILATATVSPEDHGNVTVAVDWSITADVHDSYLLAIQELNSRGNVQATFLFDPSWGLFPTDSWVKGQGLRSTFTLSRPAGAERVNLSLVRPEPDLGPPLAELGQRIADARQLTLTLHKQ